MAEFGAYQTIRRSRSPPRRSKTKQAELLQRLRDNYPFFHPRYVGQMLKPPHPAAVVGYLAAMLINPNNHALDGGPATARMEKEVVAAAGRRCSATGTHLGHLTSSGTIANLEALFVAREIHPARGSRTARTRTTRTAGCATCSASSGTPVATDAGGRMDLDALEDLLATGTVGTVVLTAGTTGLGAIDPIDVALPLCRSYGARVHVDAAYGGFFTPDRRRHAPTGWPAAPFAGHRRVRLGGHRPAQARPAAVRLRRGDLPRPAASAGYYLHDSPVHLLHLRRAAPRARSPSSARGPARPPPRCG